MFCRGKSETGRKEVNGRVPNNSAGTEVTSKYCEEHDD